MDEDSQSSVKFVSHLLTKIDVVKFDDTNNFEMWTCEVMDALTHQTSKTLYVWKKSRRRLLTKIGTR